MERSYFVKFKKQRCGEYGAFVDDLELLTLALKDQIRDDVELILEPGYVIPTTLTHCYNAILSATDTKIYHDCGEHGCGIVVEDEYAKR